MKSKRSSRINGFHKRSLKERLEEISLWVDSNEVSGLQTGAVKTDVADKMIENAVGFFEMPLGVATNFLINGTDVLVPMAIEEPSVIAAASNAARMARSGGGFLAEADSADMIAQIELITPIKGAAAAILDASEEIIEMANRTQPELVALGGGVVDLTVREKNVGEDRIVVHLVVNCLDAMGANMVNTMAEAISSRLGELALARVGLRILTNLADRRLVRAKCNVPLKALERNDLSGEVVANGIVAASEFAAADSYRAATNNKGIFNGMDAVLLSTGNDWRAVEAGGHAYAARDGRYRSLTEWTINKDALSGRLELPMAVGIVGGASKVHPTARRCINLLGVDSAAELAQVVASVGLASNLAALAALAGEGIQAGHMRLHRRRLS